MHPVYLLRLGVLAATSAGCLTLLTACKNTAPADQLTIVQGTVLSATTGRPLPGVLLGIESYSGGLFGPTYYHFSGDSTRTNAQGKYELHFYNKAGLYYMVSFEPYSITYASPRPYVPSGYAFITNNTDTRSDLTLGHTNLIDFKPDEQRTVALRIRNRNTGYQLLYINYKTLHGNNLDTTTYLRGFYPLGVIPKFSYRKLTATGAVVKDTLIAPVVQNPASLPPDTLRATLTFIR